MKFLIFIFIYILSSTTFASIYSEVDCTSNTWIKTKINKKPILKYLNSNIKRGQAAVISILDKKKKPFLKIYPWDGINYKLKKGYKIIEKENKSVSFFQIKVKNKKNEIYKVSCKKN